MNTVQLNACTIADLIKACDNGRKSGDWYCIGAKIAGHAIEIKGFGRWLQIFRIHLSVGSTKHIEYEANGWSTVVNHGQGEAPSVKAFREQIATALRYHSING